MKNQLVVGEEKFTLLYIDDEELQDRFDAFVTALRLLGYKDKSSHFFSTVWENIAILFTGDSYEVFMKVKTHGYDIDFVEFEVSSLFGSKRFIYDRKEKSRQDLYEMFDKVLSYV